MKIAGIVAEYNPFHNGHVYHVKKTREICGADAVAAVMSGNFVQRGSPAAADKFSRAETALRCGVDLVVELPCVFACRSAETFAGGAVKLLEAIGCDFISFGTETEDVDKLQKTADFLKNNGELFFAEMSKHLKEGKSYPRAFSEAVQSGLLSTPNNTLAVEYLKANSRMRPVAILRKGSFHDGAGSASDIREKMLNGEPYGDLVPPSTSEILKKACTADYKIYEKLVLFKLRTSKKELLANTPDVSEGLENRIYEAAFNSSSFAELLENIKTKRYTMARIRRILANFLIGITKDDIGLSPQYIRVLGMNRTGAEILAGLRKNAPLPVITKTADAAKSRMLDLDIAASDVYSVISSSFGSMDYKTSPVVIK